MGSEMCIRDSYARGARCCERRRSGKAVRFGRSASTGNPGRGRDTPPDARLWFFLDTAQDSFPARWSLSAVRKMLATIGVFGFLASSAPLRAAPHQRVSQLHMGALESQPVIIVPGFGNADIDYSTPLGQSADVGLESVLGRRGFTDVRTLKCERFEWARVIFGLLGASSIGRGPRQTARRTRGSSSAFARP